VRCFALTIGRMWFGLSGLLADLYGLDGLTYLRISCTKVLEKFVAMNSQLLLC
jgi:hypothetical protein